MFLKLFIITIVLILVLCALRQLIYTLTAQKEITGRRTYYGR